MVRGSEEQAAPMPLRAIRRFDVFAEVNRLEALGEGRPEAEAKGHGVWLAKIVAGRRHGRSADTDHPAGSGRADAPATAGRRREDSAFKSAGGELQTDETFDSEIVGRMGVEFYERVFAPAIRAAVERGETYESFRDTIREGWKPRR